MRHAAITTAIPLLLSTQEPGILFPLCEAEGGSDRWSRRSSTSVECHSVRLVSSSNRMPPSRREFVVDEDTVIRIAVVVD